MSACSDWPHWQKEFFSCHFRIRYRQVASSSCRKRKVPPPDTTAGVQLADASDLKGVYARAVKHKSSGTVTAYKYEPRFTPPREEVDDGTTRRFSRLALGEYHTRGEAKIVLQVARFYYDKDQGCVELDDGQFKFFIPPMNEQERGLAGEEKRKWVTNKAKQVYADLWIQRRNLKQLSVGNRTGACSNHDSDIGVPAEIPSIASTSALEVPSCLAPLLSCDVVDNYCETFSGSGDMMFDELLRPDSANFLPRQSSLNCQMHYLGFGQILGDPSLPQADGVTQGIQGSVDAHFDFQQGWDLVGASGSRSNFFAKPRDPVLQQLVHRQKQQLEVSALRNVGLEHQLCESQIQISELQHEIERLRQENELLSSTRLQRFANSQMA